MSQKSQLGSEESFRSKYWMKKSIHVVSLTNSKAQFEQFQKASTERWHHQNSPEKSSNGDKSGVIMLADRSKSSEKKPNVFHYNNK